MPNKWIVFFTCYDWLLKPRDSICYTPSGTIYGFRVRGFQFLIVLKKMVLGIHCLF